MSKKAFDKIAAGLRDAIAIAKAEADPSTYRVHYPDGKGGKFLKVIEQRRKENVAKARRARKATKRWEQ